MGQAASDQKMDTDAADCNGNSNFQTTVTTTLSCAGNNSPLLSRGGNGGGISFSPTKNTVSNTKTNYATKRTRQPDSSKFNRSNRKSKNCAIFYFKHLDTDGENKGWSTQASEVIFFYDFYMFLFFI